MKKLILLLLLILIGTTFSSCATFQTATANTPEWIGQQIRPSQLFINGNISFSGKLYDGSTYFVFQDDTIDLDTGYYYNSLMKDWGWSFDGGDKWIATTEFSRRPKLGYIYLNPNKRIAIYIYPTGTYSEFKVSIIDEFGVEVPVKDYDIIKDDPLQQF